MPQMMSRENVELILMIFSVSLKVPMFTQQNLSILKTLGDFCLKDFMVICKDLKFIQIFEQIMQIIVNLQEMRPCPIYDQYLISMFCGMSE